MIIALRLIIIALFTSALFVVPAIAPCGPTEAPTADHSPEAAFMPDVLVWIDAQNPDTHWVALTYPRLVPKEIAENHLHRLLQETGWSAFNISISDDSVMESGEKPMTSVEFATPQALRMDKGVVPLESIIKALKDQRRIVIQCVASSLFDFRGLRDFENGYVKITLESGKNTYRYTVLVKDSEFDTLGLPEGDVPEQQALSTGRWQEIMIKTLIILLALAVASMAYIITVRYTARSREKRD